MGNIIGESSAHDVKLVVMSVAANSRLFGGALGLPSSTLDRILKDNPRDLREALGQVIDTWLARRYDTERFGLPSWRTLVGAVASPAGGHNPRLAQEIADDHPGRVLYTITIYTYYLGHTP